MPDVGSESEPLVAVAMATFEPEPELLERQLASLREQTHANWVCVISDDASSPERFADSSARSKRTRASRVARKQRLGFYRNFERALGWFRARPSSSRSGTRTTADIRRSRPLFGRSRAPTRLQRRSRRSPRRGRHLADPLARAPQQLHEPRFAAFREHRHRGRFDVSARPHRLVLPFPGAPGRPTTTTGPPSRSRERPHRIRRPPASRLCPAPGAVLGHEAMEARPQIRRRQRLQPPRRDPGAARERWREAYEDEWCGIAARGRALEERWELSPPTAAPRAAWPGIARCAPGRGWR